MSRPRILLAVYHFPPSAAVGGLRAARLARLLPEFGWEPYVITVRESDRDSTQGTDTTRLAGLEAVPIERTPAPSGPLAVYIRAKSRLRRQSHPPGAVPEDARTSSFPPSGAAARRETLIRRLKRYVVSLLIRMPDEEKSWSVFAVLPAIRLIRRHGIDWILTSGPPFSAHLVGLMARMLTRARWVADFRDPWVDLMPERDPQVRSWLSDRIETWMETLVFRWADRVLTTTEPMRATMMQRHPDMLAGKVVHLPNGIDLEQIPDDCVEKYGPLTITYAGTLYFDRTPEPLFQAFGELMSEGSAQAGDFRIKLVGNCRSIGGADTMEVARRYGIESAVEVSGRVPRAEAIRIMRRSHLLLVLAPPNHDLVLPAKIFDYLGSGSKLLALAGHGATADLMRETGAGMCVAPNDVPALKRYLGDLLKSGRYRCLRNEPASFARYHARATAGQLAAELSRARRGDGLPLWT